MVGPVRREKRGRRPGEGNGIKLYELNILLDGVQRVQCTVGPDSRGREGTPPGEGKKPEVKGKLLYM